MWPSRTIAMTGGRDQMLSVMVSFGHLGSSAKLLGVPIHHMERLFGTHFFPIFSHFFSIFFAFFFPFFPFFLLFFAFFRGFWQFSPNLYLFWASPIFIGEPSGDPLPSPFPKQEGFNREKGCQLVAGLQMEMGWSRNLKQCTTRGLSQ